MEKEFDLQAEEPQISEKVAATERTRTSLLEDDMNFLEVVSVIPTAPPTHFLKSIVLFISGSTLRLYVWDKRNNLWRFTSLT